MDHLDYPTETLWEDRRNWFESIEQSYAGEGSYIVSEQACALIFEVQAAFCVGAWVTVLIVAMAVVDASLREAELPGFKGNSKLLIDAANANSKLQELRLKRNTYVHVDPDKPAITVDQQWFERKRLEEEARLAVHLMFETFYLSPGV